MMMKKYIIITALLLSTGAIAFAQSPKIIRYKGTLTGPDGSPVKDGVYMMKFKIYNHWSADSVLWESGDSIPVQTNNGNFTYALGSTIRLPESLSKYAPLWLGITAEIPDSREEIVFLPIDNPVRGEFEKEAMPGDSLARDNGQDSISANSGPTNTSPENPAGSSGNESGAKAFIKFGLDFNGKCKSPNTYNSEKRKINEGLAISLEFLNIEQYGGVATGVGAEFELPRSPKYSHGNFYFASVYFSLKFKIFPREPCDYFPFFTGKIGYDFLWADDDFIYARLLKTNLSGGMAWGAGIGLNILQLIAVEALYQVNNGTVSVSDTHSGFSYSRISLTVGVFH